MITKEIINDIAIKYFLSDIIDYIPVNAKIKRKAIEGIIQRSITEEEQKKLSLNECLNFEENNRVIGHFITVLEETLSHCNLSSLYKNIQTLSIIEKPKTIKEKLLEFFSIKEAGHYSQKSNCIRIHTKKDISEDYYDSTKTHELIHMATTRKDGDIYLCGFNQYKYPIDFARGLNEGYTELINRRYFSRRGAGSYQELQPIAAQIEKLVGRKQMEKFFFSNDLDGLITSMEKYTSRESVLRLIQKMDYIYKCIGKPGEKLIQSKLCREAIVDIANMNLNRFKQDFESGKISEEEYSARLFYLELSTHNLTPIFYFPEGAKFASDVYIIKYPDNSELYLPFKRYKEVVKEYYESKKNNPIYTYTPWKNENGLGIDNIITREENIQAIISQEQANGRNPDEVSAEIDRMIKENPSQIPTKSTILKPL